MFFKIEFNTPEEFFLGHKPVKFEWGSIDPLEILKKHENKPAETKTYHSTVSNFFFD
jgi:hypothetical protein